MVLIRQVEVDENYKFEVIMSWALVYFKFAYSLQLWLDNISEQLKGISISHEKYNVSELRKKNTEDRKINSLRIRICRSRSLL